MSLHRWGSPTPNPVLPSPGYCSPGAEEEDEEEDEEGASLSICSSCWNLAHPTAGPCAKPGMSHVLVTPQQGRQQPASATWGNPAASGFRQQPSTHRRLCPARAPLLIQGKREAAASTAAPASGTEGRGPRRGTRAAFRQPGEPNAAPCHLHTAYRNRHISGKHLRSGEEPHVCYTKVKKTDRNH